MFCIEYEKTAAMFGRVTKTYPNFPKESAGSLQVCCPLPIICKTQATASIKASMIGVDSFIYNTRYSRPQQGSRVNIRAKEICWKVLIYKGCFCGIVAAASAFVSPFARLSVKSICWRSVLRNS